MKLGGVCFVGSNMYAKANNQSAPDYDKNKPTNSIIFDDANNFNGCSMSEFLPHKDLKFDNNIELDDILNALMKMKQGI